MVGLRTPENDKFLAYWRIVQDAAAEKGKIFYLDAGQGYEEETETLDCEDCSGWLIDRAKKEEFEKFFHSDTGAVPEEWDDDYVLAAWEKKDGKIVITFE